MTDAKLALVEFLLMSIDLQDSARRSLEWLVAHTPVPQAAVLIVEAVSNEMLLVAEHGVPSIAIVTSHSVATTGRIRWWKP